MKNLLTFLDGKKAMIGGILHAVNAYLAASGVIELNLSALIATIILLLTGIGIGATNSVLGARNYLGERVKD